MILVRNVFQLKFGQAKEATALWKEGAALGDRLGFARGKSRILTDLAGAPFYTLVFENEFENLGEYERSAQSLMSHPEWQAWYARALPHLEGGRREILNIVV
jgi:hypothetical protein